MGALVSGRPVVPEPQGMIARGNPRSPFRARFNATSCQSREAASPIHEVSSEIFRLFCAAYLKSCLAMADSPASLCPKPAPSWIPNEEIHHGSRFYHYHHSPCVSPLVLFVLARRKGELAPSYRADAAHVSPYTHSDNPSSTGLGISSPGRTHFRVRPGEQSQYFSECAKKSRLLPTRNLSADGV